MPLPAEARTIVTAAVRDLTVGVTELHVHPALDTPELRAFTPSWSSRVGDAHLVTHDNSFKNALTKAGATLISYRDIRAAQRS